MLRLRNLSLLLSLTIIAAERPVSAQIDPLAAAAKLPLIPGLTILASRVGDPTVAEQTVEFDVHAAQLDATLAYSCLFDATNGVRRIDFLGVIR